MLTDMRTTWDNESTDATRDFEQKILGNAPNYADDERYNHIVKLLENYDMEIMLAIVLIERFSLDATLIHRDNLKLASKLNPEEKSLLTNVLCEGFLGFDMSFKPPVH